MTGDLETPRVTARIRTSEWKKEENARNSRNNSRVCARNIRIANYGVDVTAGVCVQTHMQLVMRVCARVRLNEKLK